MPRSKIIYGDEVLIDLTGDTVTADTLAEGVTAHDKAGNAITGTMAAGPSVETCTVEVIKTVGPASIYQYSVVLYDPDTGIYSEYFHSDNNQTRAGDEDDDGGGDSAASEPFYEGIFSNVVCGTHLYLYMESPMTDANIQVSTMGGAAFVENLRCSFSGHWIVCTAPDTAGAVATISVSASW